jgi:hypothetical protein
MENSYLIAAVLIIIVFSGIVAYYFLTTEPKVPFIDGTPVRCSVDAKNGAGAVSAIYRVEKGKLRHYPNPDIAISWDPNFPATTTIEDCSMYTAGPPMEMNV